MPVGIGHHASQLSESYRHRTWITPSPNTHATPYQTPLGVIAYSKFEKETYG